MRAVRGVLAVEGVQTGDGRLLVAGSLTWADLPLPLGWLQEEQHGDLLSGAVQVGTIDTIVRAGQDITFTGTIDDEQADGAELVRRLEAGTAALGNRVGISIDPDDYAVEIILSDPSEEEAILLASARPAYTIAGTGSLPVLTAAAGDPDPGEDGGEDGVVIFEDSADTILERYTRMRIRGATACAIAAFSGAWMELDGEATDEPAEPAAVTAAASPIRPAASAFALPEPQPEMRGMREVYGMPVEELLVEQRDGSLAVPLVITEPDANGVRLVFGHAARWGACHVGYPGECVTPPESAAAYAHFHVGEVVCDGGERVATGALTVGCDHAPPSMRLSEARDHYANSGLGWADVRVSNGVHGPWVSGVVRPEVTDAQIRVLRALSLSGDWRRTGTDLEFIAALSVNVPGFPIAREALYASALPAIHEAPDARVYMVDGVQQSLVASGIVTRCADCQRRASLAAGVEGGLLTAEPDARIDELLTLVKRLDLRTRHLAPAASEMALGRIRGNGHTAPVTT